MNFLRLALKFLTVERALIAVLAIGFGVQSCRYQALEVEHAKDQTSLAVCRERTSALGEQLKAQNQAVAALQAAGEAHKKAVAQAEAQADRVAKDTAARVEAIQNEKVPAACEAAVDWLAEKAKAQSHLWK